MTYGIFPLWRIRYRTPGGKERVAYQMAPKRGVGRLAGVRTAAHVRVGGRATLLALECLDEHPIMRGDERIGHKRILLACEAA